MSSSELIKLKNKIFEDLKYDERFSGVGVSANKVILFVKDNMQIPYSDGVVVSKAIFKSKSFATVLRHKFRPVVSGVSIGALNGLTGTAGIIVNDLIISASHVVSSNPVGLNGYDLVIQPGPADGGTINDKIGTTIYYDILRDYIYGDIGIVKLNTKYKNFVYGVGAVKNFVNPIISTKVVKVGRTTGMTTGVIYATNVDAKVYYPELSKDIFIRNQFVVYGNRFSDAGDSGSAVIYSDKYAGIVIAGDINHTLCTPSSYIIKKIKEVNK